MLWPIIYAWMCVKLTDSLCSLNYDPRFEGCLGALCISTHLIVVQVNVRVARLAETIITIHVYLAATR